MLDHKQEGTGWNTKAPTRKTVQLRVERTIHGHPNGNVANLVRMLKLVEVDHHFVPTRTGSEDDLQIVYSIKGLSNDVVKLRVSCDMHDPKIIFERELTAEEKKDGKKKLIKWNGVPNCAGGPVKDILPYPVLGDLKVVLWHAAIQSEEKATRVLYREIKFESVTWKEVYLSVTGLASDQFAAATTPEHQRLWIQYKLNELGYLAGPLSKTPGTNSLLRALFRYTLAHPNLPKIIDFQTRDIAPGTCSWGWRQPWEAKFGTVDNLCSGGTTPDGKALMKRLQDNEKPRTDLVEEPKVFLDENVKSRIIIDHDIYYINKDFARNNANADYDLEFLNRFCWPLKVRVFLVARADADATKPGVDSPEAVGAIDMDWIAFDPPEDISCVPVETKASIPPKLKTRAREFIAETHKKVAGQYGDEYNALDNCPVSAGGWRPSDGDMSGFFEKIESAPKDRTFIGCVPIQFKGSYIGGDNYKIQARIALDGYPNSDAVKQEHLKLKGLENAFEDPAPEKPPYPLNARTGELTNWRRHHVLRELHWDSIDYREISWFPVIDNFRAAHIILVPPVNAPVQVGKLLPASDLQDLAHTMISDPGAPENNLREFQYRAGSEVFNPAAMYPLPFLPLKDWETAKPLNNTGPVATDPKARYRNYSTYFNAATLGWPTYSLMVPVARKLRQSISSLNLGYGLLILRAGYFPEPDFSKLLPDDVFQATVADHKGIKIDKSIAVGMDYGLVLLDRIGSDKYSETYYVTHEISHCLFGSHASGTPTDHDKNDKNCMMYYNTENDGIAFGWGVKTAPEKYTIRLLIEYNAAHKDECGSASGAWVRETGGARQIPEIPNVDFRAFDLTGTIAEINGALAGTVITRANWMDKKASFKVVLATSTLTKTIPPKMSVKLPHRINVSAAERSSSPLASIKAEPMDIKAAEPRFCGKCVLKLRGWRVGTAAATATTAPVTSEVPEKSPATPVNGRMVFEGYYVAQGDITFAIKGAPTVVKFGMDARDPGNRKALMGPFQFLHKHTFYWESSTGNLKDLKMPTREVVKYRRATQTAPFNEFADPDQEFAQSGGAGSDGNGSDMHSMRLPALICSRNWGIPVGGSSLIATQSYQYCTKDKYSLDDADWIDIPNSQFRLEKSVYQMGKDWVMMFKKTNAPENPVPFNFEVHYRIGPALSFEPDLEPNKFAGATHANPVKTYISDPKYNLINQLVWAAGDRTLTIKNKNFSETPTTIEALVKAGFAIRGTPPTK